jgi:hypothetical protein
VKDKVPQEAWSDTKSSFSHFIIFCCTSYAHVSKDLRRKLDSQSEKCVFIGYEQSKVYKLYNPVTKKFLMSRDLKFLEANTGVTKKIKQWIAKIHYSKYMNMWKS